MGRWSTYPTTVEDCLTLSILDLKELGFIDGSQGFATGNINTTRRGEIVASYRVKVDSNTANPSILFSYSYGNEEIKYKIRMITIESNLGKGLRYYFVCPNTNEQCIKLYKPPTEKYFLHRKVLSNKTNKNLMALIYNNTKNKLLWFR